MLVLSRKSGEIITIGNLITIKVITIKGKVVKIGIEAPKESRILRGEITGLSEGTGEGLNGS